MRHPLAFIPAGARKPLLFTFLILTLVLLALLQALDQPLRTDAAPYGIVSFELAGDPGTARLITDSWKDTRLRLTAAAGLGIDYAFMPVYALALGLGTLLAAQRHEGLVKSMGALAGYMALSALIFDAVENYALFRVLLGEGESGYPALAALCAILKFGLILLAMSYSLAARLLPKQMSS